MAEKPKSLEVKCVVVGDGAVGKTCMLITYTAGKFPEEYVPTLFDNFNKNLEHSNNEVRLSLFDTAGQEDYDSMRPLSYPDTNVFLVCYSVNSENSFENVESKWCPEVRQHCPNVPILLVGTKADIRDTDPDSCIPKERIEELIEQVGAAGYVECSSMKNQNLKEVFYKAMDVAIEQIKMENEVEHSTKKGKDGKKCILQ